MKVEKLVELRNMMEKVIDDYIARMGDEFVQEGEKVNVISPPMDIYEDGNRQIIFMETPSLQETSIQFHFKSGNLVFLGEKGRTDENGTNYLHMERSMGSYFKIVPLMKDEKLVEEVNHSYKLGVVKITVKYGV